MNSTSSFLKILTSFRWSTLLTSARLLALSVCLLSRLILMRTVREGVHNTTVCLSHSSPTHVLIHRTVRFIFARLRKWGDKIFYRSYCLTLTKLWNPEVQCVSFVSCFSVCDASNQPKVRCKSDGRNCRSIKTRNVIYATQLLVFNLNATSIKICLNCVICKAWNEKEATATVRCVCLVWWFARPVWEGTLGKFMSNFSQPHAWVGRESGVSPPLPWNLAPNPRSNHSPHRAY